MKQMHVFSDVYMKIRHGTTRRLALVVPAIAKMIKKLAPRHYVCEKTCFLLAFGNCFDENMDSEFVEFFQNSQNYNYNYDYYNYN